MEVSWLTFDEDNLQVFPSASQTGEVKIVLALVRQDMDCNLHKKMKNSPHAFAQYRKIGDCRLIFARKTCKNLEVSNGVSEICKADVSSIMGLHLCLYISVQRKKEFHVGMLSYSIQKRKWFLAEHCFWICARGNVDCHDPGYSQAWEGRKCTFKKM